VTHIAFGDMRRAATYLTSLPAKTVHLDSHFALWWPILNVPGWNVRILNFESQVRKREFTAVADGYAVTGGAREPYYGCYPCIPRSEEIALAEGWVLLWELESPIGPTMWRPEVLRVWELPGSRAAPIEGRP
jgi:hypothetical protein